MEERRHQDMLAVAYEATTSGVAAILAGGRTPEKAVEVAESAGRLLDRLLARLDQAHRPACRAKCAWCCYVSVACSPPEAIAVAAYVRSRLNKRDRRQVAARIDAVSDQTRGLDAAARARLRVPCPFLGDDVCLVHPARPLACRGWHSFDVEQCRRHWRDPASQVDASGARLAVRGVVSSGLRDALERAGLCADGVDLVAAVRLVLGDQGAAATWLRGEDAFAAVKWQG